ncbi:hypothetical protein CSA37_06445 [Candidatus Fermentibacteria bacterium]|nr:MAG: hypothetical protein CSA37_06445 [Candidatus Fermentibacteria bacterium]
MKYIFSSICIAALAALASVAGANTPTDIPWPVGSTVPLMNYTKTLLNSYGDPQNNWELKRFHCGIDIDSHTEDPICTAVRCVINNATISHWFSTPLGKPYLEWNVVTTEGDSICHEDYGWVYEHLNDPRDIHGERPWVQVNEGDTIQTMNPYVQTVHTHLKWTTWDFNDTCYVNPLDYLMPRASGSTFTWTFNPSGYANAYEFFFLEQCEPASWPDSPDLLNILDPENLCGPIDAFVGFGLSGVGQSTTPNSGTNDLAAERIEWCIQFLSTSGPELVEQKYLVNFDCPLSYNPDDRVQQLYFKFDYDDMFSYTTGNYEGLVVCITNCGDMQGWENLGISNIAENCWQTNTDINGTEVTVNPVLAGYPDGEYEIEAILYSHDPDVSQTCVQGCELHNFHPALCEVVISDALTDETYYHGQWIPDGSGLEAMLNIITNTEVQPATNLDVTLIFTEEMNTSSVDAVLGPLDITGGSWSSTVVENDTWTGEVYIPASLTDNVYTLLVSAEDTDGNALMDPEGAGTVPGPACDSHHALLLGFSAGVEWTRSLHSDIDGSPKLADIDLDGDPDIVLQTSDGWVDVLDDNGGSMGGWPVSGGWSAGDPDVWASPAVVNLSGNSSPEILAVHPYGCNGFLSTGSPLNPWYGVFATAFRWHALCSPVAGNFNGTGANEYVLGRQRAQGVINSINLLARENDGSSLWFTLWGEDESVSSTPSLADVDSDGALEVIVISDNTSFQRDNSSSYGTVYCLSASSGTVEWNTHVGGSSVYGGIATADLDSDDYLEIVAGAVSGSDAISVLDGSTGSIQYSVPTDGGIYAGASIADIDGDGDNDIVVSSTGGMLYCLDGPTGSSLSGFPVDLGTWTDDGVSIGDIDSDSHLELVIAGMDGRLYVINHDGSNAGGFPLRISSANSLSGQPALGDIDGDGRLEIVFGEKQRSVIHCVELEDNTAFNYLPWPQFQHDAGNTGCFPQDNDPPEPPEDLEGNLTVLGDKALVNLSWTLSPDDPADVCAYRIYRQLLPYEGIEYYLESVPPGTTSYFDAFRFYYNSKVLYSVRAWDGVSESGVSTIFRIQDNDLISLGCPVRAIPNSGTELSLSSTTGIAAVGSDCSILTDGLYEDIYTQSGMVDCVEIDLGKPCLVYDVSVIRGSADYVNLQENESPESCRYTFSADGNLFSSEAGTARYVRVYGADGASEIEVYGSSSDDISSALIDIVRTDSGSFTAESVSGEELTMQVYDLTGRAVWEGKSVSSVTWPSVNSSGNQVPAGVYLLRVETEDGESITSKAVIR